MWWVSVALGYETDQITDRTLALADATEVIDARMNALLVEAAARANARTRCQGDDDELREALAREIVSLTSRPHPVPHRGAARSLGYGQYSAWIETSPEVDRRDFLARDDVFGPVRVRDSAVLALAGVCSTIRVGDVLIGTDKLDHFLDTGYHYTRRPDADAAIRYGTRTERSFYGLWTSKAFSYADLAANEAGYRFYEGLLTPGSAVVRGADRCALPTGTFTWRDWITPEMDEAWNPSVYTRRVGAIVRAHVASQPARYCPTWEALGGPDYDAHLAALAVPPYVGPRHPRREDPYGLGDLCRVPADVSSSGDRP